MNTPYQMIIAQAIANDFEPGSVAWIRHRAEADRVIEALHQRGISLVVERTCKTCGANVNNVCARGAGDLRPCGPYDFKAWRARSAG